MTLENKETTTTEDFKETKKEETEEAEAVLNANLEKTDEEKPAKKEKREMDSEYLVLFWMSVGLLAFFVIAAIGFYIIGDKLINAGAECNIRKFTGLYCPGCGGTRAFYYLTRLQIIKSLWYHPIVLYTVVSLIVFIVNTILYRNNKKCIEKLNPFVLLYVGLGLFLLTFIVRNIIIIVFRVYLIG